MKKLSLNIMIICEITCEIKGTLVHIITYFYSIKNVAYKYREILQCDALHTSVMI